jgi:hypothetical protein
MPIAHSSHKTAYPKLSASGGRLKAPNQAGELSVKTAHPRQAKFISAEAVFAPTCGGWAVAAMASRMQMQVPWTADRLARRWPSPLRAPKVAPDP